MKITNFINPVSPKDERACITWFRLSLLLGLMTVACITYMQLCQLMIWSSYRQEYKKNSNITKQFAHITEEKKKLTDLEQALKQKLDTITNMSDQSSKRIEQLHALFKACTQDVRLASCSLTGDGTVITLNCTNVEQAQACCSSLNQGRKFTDLKITSIYPAKQSINMTLKTVQNSNNQTRYEK